ncbi:MAG: pyridoxal phosphate-dependent aminotransferase [Proteobacteria bacterium]|nr:pyridoxal phosphate-dependent aminotransferase [Pseudomonadota bacterium]
MFLNQFPPMGVYETLFHFHAATGLYMGDENTRPWAQGFPVTTQLPGGPILPPSVEFGPNDLKYPGATGVQPLRKAISDYYNHFYGSQISEENVAVFAGGRPAIFAALMHLQPDVNVLIEETEYTPYYDMLKMLNRNHTLIPSGPDNNFRPTLADYQSTRNKLDCRSLIVKSNPCNPTGVTWSGQQLSDLVKLGSEEKQGALFDEAYEFFHEGGPVSAMKYVKNIDSSNIFVVGAATKGLQAPGLRTGWIIAAQKHIELFRNFSSIGMGGVSRPAQIYVTNLLENARVIKAREAVSEFYNKQRDFYYRGLSDCGIELSTGAGGFYHWGKLPRGLSAVEFNKRLFKHNAAILPGTLCDMHRRGDAGEHGNYIRFSFGPVLPETNFENIRIIEACLK